MGTKTKSFIVRPLFKFCTCLSCGALSKLFHFSELQLLCLWCRNLRNNGFMCVRCFTTAHYMWASCLASDKHICTNVCVTDINNLLVSGSAEEFNYTRMGSSTVIEGVNDRADMVETRKTFTLLGKRKCPAQGVAIFSFLKKMKGRDAQGACV